MTGQTHDLHGHPRNDPRWQVLADSRDSKLHEEDRSIHKAVIIARFVGFTRDIPQYLQPLIQQHMDLARAFWSQNQPCTTLLIIQELSEGGISAADRLLIKFLLQLMPIDLYQLLDQDHQYYSMATEEFQRTTGVPFPDDAAVVIFIGSSACYN